MRLAICWFAMSLGSFGMAVFFLFQPLFPTPIIVVLLIFSLLAPFEGWYWLQVWLHPERHPWEKQP